MQLSGGSGVGDSVWEAAVTLGSLFTALWGGLAWKALGVLPPLPGWRGSHSPQPNSLPRLQGASPPQKGRPGGGGQEARGRPPSCAEGRREQSLERERHPSPRLRAAPSLWKTEHRSGEGPGAAVQAQHGEGSQQQQPTILQPGDTVPETLGPARPSLALPSFSELRTGAF